MQPKQNTESEFTCKFHSVCNTVIGVLVTCRSILTSCYSITTNFVFDILFLTFVLLCFLCRCRCEFDLIVINWKCFSEFLSFIGFSHVSCSLVAFLVLNSINFSLELLDTKQALELWMILFNASDL
jgi:hypothetical protein